MKDDQIAAKQDAACRLFGYIYLLRYRREPYPWEWVLGWALICGALAVVRPVEAQVLAAVHCAARDVQRALGLVERGG